jgi:hypothetical protein
LALKKNQKYCFGELGNTTGQHSTAQHCSPGFAKLQAQAQAQNQASIVRQGSPRFAKVRQGSPRFAKLYLALALKKNQKLCFRELENTTSMNLNLIYLLFRLFKAIYSYRMCKLLSNTSFKVN